LGDGIVKPRFAVAILIQYAARVGHFRLWPELEVLEWGNMVWLRAEQLSEERWEQCRCLPDADRYLVLDDGQLMLVDTLVPRGHLPDGNWQPIAGWLEVYLPSSGWPGSVPSRAAVSLVRSTEPQAANWLVISLRAWHDYAVTAPQVRLSQLSFAATRDGCVAVRGQPLPPILGEQFVETQGIAVPAGWTWRPAVEPAVLREVFGLALGECVLWMGIHNCQKILADDWVRATRSAARLTLQGVERAN
jgi:hypothetical protein